MKKIDLYDIIFNVCECVSALIFVGALIYVCTYLGGNKSPLFPDEEVYRLTEWEFTDEFGNKEVLTTTIHSDVKNLDIAEYVTILPDTVEDGYVFSILNRSNLKIYVEDECVYEWHKSEAPVIGGPPKNSYLFLNLKSEYAGKHLKLAYEDKNWSGILFEGFAGPKDAVIRTLQQKAGVPHFVMSVFLLLFSLVIVLTSFGLRWTLKQNINLIYAALGVFVSSCWLTFDSFEFQFITNTRFIDGFMSYMCTLSLSFPFIIYLDHIQDRRYRRFYSIIALLEGLNIVVFTTLHITNVIMFSDTLLYIDIVVGIGVLGMFLITLYDLRKPVSKNYRITSIGFVLLMVCGIAEIFLIQLKVDRIEGGALLVGLYILLGFAIAQQVTDLKRVQQERNAANAAALAKTQFLANMSHEIRTPINSILGMNEMILRENDNPTVESYAKMISDSGQILLSLINDVLDFSKIQSGMSDIKCGIYNPTRMFEKVAAILEERASAKNINVKISTPVSFPATLYGDEKHIVQILLNVLTNAVKYTDDGSVTFTAECRYEEEKPVLLFYVSDTGKGIRKEDLASIFDPFTRKDMSINRSVQGTGLGLSISQQLAEAMGGKITVDSVFGKGSTFYIEIPQEAKEGKATEADDLDELVNSFRLVKENTIVTDSGIEDDDLSDIDENYTVSDVRVLSVDDNNANLIVVQEFLRDTGIRLDSAESGKKAITECTINKYDLILMDHMMPDPDGIKSMHQIREGKDSVNKDTPIIILTANALKGSKAKYLEEGFNNYLSKPVDSKRLLRMIRKYLPTEKVLQKQKKEEKKIEKKITPVVVPVVSTDAQPLDIAALYERFENRESTINVILTEIVKEGEKKIALLPKLFNEGDIANYAIEAHGVKGVMASSCANHLSETAKSHEFAAKEGREDFIRDNIDSFLKEYRELVDFVRNYLESKGITVDVLRVVDLTKDGALNEEDLVDAAIDALNDFDVDKALTVLERLSTVVDEDGLKAIEKITKLTDDFEYIKAIDALKDFKGGCKP